MKYPLSELPADAQLQCVVITDTRVWWPDESTGLTHLSLSSLSRLGQLPDCVYLLGELQQQPVYLLKVAKLDVDEASLISLRAVRFRLHDDSFYWYSRAWQLAHFIDSHQYCGRCGTPMTFSTKELGAECTPCQHTSYPRISPCIIVAIRRGRQILLARGPQFPQGMMSILAGFNEIGESLEQTLHREVKEEVGLTVKNLEYFGSQAWPFPHSLMVGYTAEYADGEICLGDDELEHADWYDIDDLPNTPPAVSISGQLIEHSVELIRLRNQ